MNCSDPSGKALIGLGAQFDITTGEYECGVEIIVYWDEDICEGGGLVVCVYIYEGVSANLDEIMLHPDVVEIISQLSLAVLANAGKDYDTLALIDLQSKIFGSSFSGAIVGIWGYDNFDSTDDYAGPFTSYSVSFKHVKVTWSHCGTCWSLAIGGTTDGKLHFSLGQTNYTEFYSSAKPKEGRT